MAQRALWKGAISFGLVYIPVQMFSADSTHDLDLTMVDKRDFSPIGYKRVNKRSGKEVSWNDIVKAYEYENDQYVVLTDEDLRRANVEATRTIDIVNFVDAPKIPPVYYEKPYYLAPTKGGEKVYALLREALKRSQKYAVAQVVIRTKQHLAVLAPMDDVIVLDTLRYADEVRPAEELDVPKGGIKTAGITEKELQMALTLIESMSEEWEPDRYHDTYREDVMAMVEKKIKAHQTKTITEPEEGEDEAPRQAKIIDLMALLKQSLDSTGGKKAAAKSSTNVRKISPAKKANSSRKQTKSAPKSKAS